jgi:sugar phosphate isomerase/epimerase
MFSHVGSIYRADCDLISLAALTVLDAGPARQTLAAKAAGFDAVGLRLHPLLPTDPIIAGNAAATDELLDALKSTGLKVTEIGVFPIKPGMDIEALSPVLSLSHKIGARYITCPVEDPDRRRSLDTFGRLCDLAETCGLEALIEFNPYSACRNLGEALAMVEGSGRDNARLLIDVLHLSRSGGKPSDLLTVEPELIALIHLCDAPPPPAQTLSTDALRAESRTARLYPGEGQLWLGELLDVLRPDVPLSVEAPSAIHAHLSVEERARRAFEATRALLARHGRMI